MSFYPSQQDDSVDGQWPQPFFQPPDGMNIPNIADNVGSGGDTFYTFTFTAADSDPNSSPQDPSTLSPTGTDDFPSSLSPIVSYSPPDNHISSSPHMLMPSPSPTHTCTITPTTPFPSSPNPTLTASSTYAPSITSSMLRCTSWPPSPPSDGSHPYSNAYLPAGPPSESTHEHSCSHPWHHQPMPSDTGHSSACPSSTAYERPHSYVSEVSGPPGPYELVPDSKKTYKKHRGINNPRVSTTKHGHGRKSHESMCCVIG